MIALLCPRRSYCWDLCTLSQALCGLLLLASFGHQLQLGYCSPVNSLLTGNYFPPNHVVSDLQTRLKKDEIASFPLNSLADLNHDAIVPGIPRDSTSHLKPKSETEGSDMSENIQVQQEVIIERRENSNNDGNSNSNSSNQNGNGNSDNDNTNSNNDNANTNIDDDDDNGDDDDDDIAEDENEDDDEVEEDYVRPQRKKTKVPMSIAILNFVAWGFAAVMIFACCGFVARWSPLVHNWLFGASSATPEEEEEEEEIDGVGKEGVKLTSLELGPLAALSPLSTKPSGGLWLGLNNYFGNGSSSSKASSGDDGNFTDYENDKNKNINMVAMVQEEGLANENDDSNNEYKLLGAARQGDEADPSMNQTSSFAYSFGVPHGRFLLPFSVPRPQDAVHQKKKKKTTMMTMTTTEELDGNEKNSGKNIFEKKGDQEEEEERMENGRAGGAEEEVEDLGDGQMTETTRRLF
jgi:hypothetical protein